MREKTALVWYENLKWELLTVTVSIDNLYLDQNNAEEYINIYKWYIESHWEEIDKLKTKITQLASEKGILYALLLLTSATLLFIL